MSVTEKNRDLSELSALLAEQTASPAKKPSVAKARQPANDNKPARALLAWPAFERLAHRGDVVRLFALRHWRDLCFPRDTVVVDDQQQYDPETGIEIRPSEAELLGAVGWKVIDRERWAFTGEMVNTYEPAQEVAPKYRTNRNGALEARLGDLLFRDGDLKQWGSTRKGAALQPVERSRGIKGGSKSSRSESAIWSYIRLCGAVSPFTAIPFSKPISSEPAIHDCYSPLPREAPTAKDRHGRYGTTEARQLLQQFGVDGSVRFHELPTEATRCPDGLIAGEQWIGGVKQPKPTGEISAPAGREPEFVREVETIDYVGYLRSRLGRNAKVLDMAITDASAKDIGVAMGLAPAYAEKRGTALIDAAIDALIEVDETARREFAPSEEKIAA
ncbi:hypothetical protein Rleg10DRAFT_5818 [Rhizobium leguminosarum bv. trifolii WSM2012]|nr:hypothetical protein Rleg10DRAFT_4168 [Rhizobium leguminosarum bv. trifolii WSM2012]EJC77124.1 hypothetical protein Rleg10DRAFT_5818 [Rhizobium leguminosarum bv. trifolii WSM2012]